MGVELSDVKGSDEKWNIRNWTVSENTENKN
jgi:hypothetical protein